VKGRLDEENIADKRILIDAVISLTNAFKEAGYNPPSSIRVDKRAFDKLLEEAAPLYNSINVKDSITNHEISIAGIIKIVLEKNENEVNAIKDQKVQT
jgi:hypothetical protein